MDVISLEGTRRAPGKGAARKARREGLVPCALYGGSIEAMSFVVPAFPLKQLVFSHEQHRIALTLEGQRFDCILKDVAYDPVTNLPIHADFQVLQSDHRVTLTVPIRFVGAAVGVIEHGGDITFQTHELHVSCLPKDMPAHIDVDVTPLQIGESIHVADLKAEGLEFLDPPTRTIASVLAPRVEVEEAPAEPVRTAGVQPEEEEEAAAS